MNKITFSKEKISFHSKVSKDILMNNIELSSGLVDDDFINDQFTIRLEAWLLANTSEKRELVYHFKRPTFLDWFFRRKRRAIFNLKVKDLLLNPPATNDTVRIYEITNKQ